MLGSGQGGEQVLTNAAVVVHGCFAQVVIYEHIAAQNQRHEDMEWDHECWYLRTREEMQPPT